MPRAPEVVRPGVPELVRFSRLEGDGVARAGEFRRLSGPLVTDPPLSDRQRLFLVGVTVHGRSGTRLDDVLDFQTVAGGIGHPPQKREALSGAVIDGVWVSHLDRSLRT